LGNDPQQNVLFHDRIAPSYDSHVTGRPQDLLARTAFQDLVTRLVAPGSTLLDFGCGTGIDAIHYANLGYRVIAYDSSGGMIEELRRKDGSRPVESFSFDYSEFARNAISWPAADAVVANFAVLNHIRDIDEWFDSVARNLAPRGWVMVSVLNPLHWTHLMTPRWWRNAMGRGPRPHSTEPCITYLHTIGSIIRAARGFHLVGRANSGSLVRYDAIRGERIWWGDQPRLLWRTPARRLLGHFVFLVLRRDA
jgi:2-polyprenyl-3-methyl-5-hydroxy-6-metoxy-1,4-benzoquinol methylase